MKPEKALLNEGGVTITRTRLTAPGHSFNLTKIHCARLERVRLNGLVSILFGRAPVFRLMIWTAKDASPICAFETKDAELVGRIQSAMGQAARANP